MSSKYGISKLYKFELVSSDVNALGVKKKEIHLIGRVL